MASNLKDNHKKLMKRLHEEIYRPSPEVLFGAYIEVRLRKLQLSKDELASKLNIELDLVDAILNGELAANIIDEDIIMDIAKFTQSDANILRIFLGRVITSVQNQSDVDQQESATKRQ